jgi:hypothetical protein
MSQTNHVVAAYDLRGYGSGGGRGLPRVAHVHGSQIPCTISNYLALGLHRRGSWAGILDVFVLWLRVGVVISGNIRRPAACEASGVCDENVWTG